MWNFEKWRPQKVGRPEKTIVSSSYYYHPQQWKEVPKLTKFPAFRKKWITKGSHDHEPILPKITIGSQVCLQVQIQVQHRSNKENFYSKIYKHKHKWIDNTAQPKIKRSSSDYKHQEPKWKDKKFLCINSL